MVVNAASLEIVQNCISMSNHVDVLERHREPLFFWDIQLTATCKVMTVNEFT